MKKLLLCGIFVVVVFTLRAAAAPALFTFNVAQIGNNVEVDGNGTVDLGGLTYDTDSGGYSGTVPNRAWLGAGIPVGSNFYDGLFGPTSFGSGDLTYATSSTGDFVFLVAYGNGIILPMNYVSGSTLTDQDVFTGASISSLGMTPGTYTYTYGAGTDSLVVNIVPEPSTWAMLGLGVVGAGVAASRRRRTA